MATRDAPGPQPSTPTTTSTTCSARRCSTAEAARNNGWARPVVYAHEEVPAHFRRYEKTGGWNTAINRRQFAIDVPQFSWPSEYRGSRRHLREQLAFLAR